MYNNASLLDRAVIFGLNKATVCVAVLVARQTSLLRII